MRLVLLVPEQTGGFDYERVSNSAFPSTPQALLPASPSDTQTPPSPATAPPAQRHPNEHHTQPVHKEAA